jgi:flagellar hook-length control protein FliK
MTIGTMPSFKNDFQFNVGAKKPLQTLNTTMQKSKPESNFNDMFQSSLKPTNTNVVEQEVNDTPTEDVLAATTVEEALEKLDVPMDASLQFVELDQQFVPVEELLTTENLAALVELPLEELEQVLQEVLQQYDMKVDLNDIWSILEVAPEIVEQLTAKFETEGLTESEEKLLQLFKLAQLVGQTTDVVYVQQNQLTNLQQALVMLTNEMQQMRNQATTQQAPTISAANTIVQVEPKVESIQPATNNSTQNESMLNQHTQASTTSTVKTVNITLPANPSAQTEALAKEVAQLMAKNQLTQGTGNIKLMLKLFPENLGQVRIEIFQQNGVISARMLASTPLGKDLIESSMNQLKTALVSQNIQVDRIDVAAALQETDKNFRDQNFSNHTFKHENDAEDEEQVDQEEQKTFTELLTEEVAQNDNDFE